MVVGMAAAMEEVGVDMEVVVATAVAEGTVETVVTRRQLLMPQNPKEVLWKSMK